MIIKLPFSFFAKFLASVIVFLLFSCEKDELEFSDLKKDTETEKIAGSKSKQNGKKLKNPYSVKNMRKALAKVKEKNKNKVEGAEQYIIIDDDYTITTSHLYLKFEPTTEEEENAMKKDSSLVLFDYPLDVEYTDEFLDNRTSSNPDAIPQYYTAIPVEETISTTITPKVLEDLYIPEEDPYFDQAIKGSGKASKADKDELFKRLLQEAYILTENEDQLEDKSVQNKSENQNKGWILGTRWTPSGNIQIWDNTFSGSENVRISPYFEYYPCDGGNTTIQDPNQPAQLTAIDDGGSTGTCQRAVYNYKKVPTYGKYVPLEGAQVLMRQWFTIRQGITDADGNFSTRSLKGNARYIIQWERHQYSIRNGSIFQAETRGPRVKEQAWNKKIKGGDDEYHGIIHSAAYDYYYGNRFGLNSPPRNNSLFSQMKIAARESAPWGIPASFSHIRSELTFGLAPQIHIKAWNKSSDLIYGVTIHELAHSSHYNLSPNSYNDIVQDAFFATNSATKNNNRRLLETWAATVEILLTNGRYREKFNLINYEYGKIDDIANSGNRQSFTIAAENHYTSAGWDMIDDFNQRSIFGSAYPLDRVSGYTINQLEGALNGANSWWKWRDNIKFMYFNSTENNLNELFDNWPN